MAKNVGTWKVDSNGMGKLVASVPKDLRPTGQTIRDATGKKVKIYAEDLRRREGNPKYE